MVSAENPATSIYRDTTEEILLTQSGVELKSQGITATKSWFVPCSNSGGLAKYPTCYARSPFTTTGALVQVSIECGNTNKVLSQSGGFVKAPTSPVLNAFPTLRTVSTGTNATLTFNARATSGSYTTWNPADSIKVQTLTTMPVVPINCGLHIEAYDKYGS